MDDRELCGGLVRLHVLHHACREPIFGQGIMDELRRHGYRPSAGTLYPILHELERGGALKSSIERSGKTSRRIYVATAAGRKALRAAKKRVWELLEELFEEELSRGTVKGAAGSRKSMRSKGDEP